MSTTFENVSYQQFKQSAGEFFRMAESSTHDQVEIGFKALSLMYFGADDYWTENECHQASIVLDLAGRECLKKELEDIRE